MGENLVCCKPNKKKNCPFFLLSLSFFLSTGALGHSFELQKGGRGAGKKSSREEERIQKRKQSLFHRLGDLLLRLRRQLREPHPGPRAVLHVLFAALGDALLFWFFILVHFIR